MVWAQNLYEKKKKNLKKNIKKQKNSTFRGFLVFKNQKIKTLQNIFSTPGGCATPLR